MPDGKTDDEVWRWRCPMGHSSITYRDDGYRCKSCKKTYYEKPKDAIDYPVFA